MDLKLQDKTVLVTGASKGIGFSTALAFAREEANVILVARDDTTLNDASSLIQAEAAVNVSTHVADLTDESACIALHQKFPEVDILVNNAGITRDNILMRMKEDEWNDIITTNLSSVFYTCKACLRDMVKARSGRIINIASVVGATGNMGQTNYAAAKAGMVGFGKSLAREVGSRNITVNTVAPGFIASDMTDALPEEHRENLKSGIALGRLGEPAEIAHMVAFLASDKADYVTGQTLHVNGGMYMG